jgi:tetratricopeptide (TPR) repeat protein
MKGRLRKILSLFALVMCLVVTSQAAWALKNVCPFCNTLVEDLDLINCPACSKVINKCLICGAKNPIKNDHCYNCDASLAESRVLMTIDKDTRERLRLGDSPRAKIDVELGQIEKRTEAEGATPELEARKVELLTQMGWWSEANMVAVQFAAQYPDAKQNKLVTACRKKALRNLAFLAMEGENRESAIEYLDAALALDPTDKVSKSLRKLAGEEK